MFANFLNAPSSRAMDRIARDLSTPLPGEARAVAEVEAAAARFVASGRDDDTDFVSNLNASKAAFSRTARRTASWRREPPRRRARFQVFHPRARRQGGGDRRGVFFHRSRRVSRVTTGNGRRARGVSRLRRRARSAAFDATATAGSVWAPPFCATIEALDVALRTLHARMLENGLGSSTGALTAVALDDLIRPSLEEMLAAVRSRLALRASHGGGGRNLRSFRRVRWRPRAARCTPPRWWSSSPRCGTRSSPSCPRRCAVVVAFARTPRRLRKFWERRSAGTRGNTNASAWPRFATTRARACGRIAGW